MKMIRDLAMLFRFVAAACSSGTKSGGAGDVTGKWVGTIAGKEGTYLELSQ